MIQRFYPTALFFLLLPLFLQGCATTIQTYTPEELALPDTYLHESGTAIIDDLEWWKAFGSDDLNTLEKKALSSLFIEDKRTGNFDLQRAFTRLRQSAAALKSAKANYYPDLTYYGYASSNEAQTKSSNNGASSQNSYNAFYGELELSYELDLWGRVRAANEASNYRFQASYEDLQTTVLTVSASIANNYLDLLSTRAELKILEEQVKLNASMVESQQARYTYGQATSLDLIQQKEQLVSSEAERPILLEQERALLASLSILMGELSTTPVNITETDLPKLPPLPVTGVPVDLLENRPDIRAARLNLLASDKDLAIAKLAYLPSFNLSAGIALSAAEPHLLIANWTKTLLASIAGVLFDGGSKKAEAKRLDAVTEELAIVYIQTVVNALNEVNNALMAEDAQAQYIKNLKEQLVYQIAAEKEAQSRYLFGTDTFLRYITQLQSVQTLQRTLVREEAELLKLRVALYKALGIKL